MKIISPKNRKPIFAKRIHRNAKCPCGSGKKAKYCCGARTTYYQKLRRLLKKNLTLDIHLFGVTLLPNQKSWNISFVRVQVNNYISALFSITKDVVHGWWYIDLCFTKKKMKINDDKYVVGK